MKKSKRNLIIKVIETTGNGVRELEKISFANGMVIDDVIECYNPFKDDCIYIAVDNANDIVVYGENGKCERYINDNCYKTQIEKAVSLTMALNQLGF